MRGTMRGEHGQATVEWTGLLLLVALALTALSQLAPRADGRQLGTTLAHSMTRAASSARAVGHESHAQGAISSTHPRPTAAKAPANPAAIAFEAAVRPKLPPLPRYLRRAGRGAGALWRKAWFACLVYERTRYALRHPESQVHGYTLPYGTALRMINNCISPVDLLRDLPDLQPRP